MKKLLLTGMILFAGAASAQAPTYTIGSLNDCSTTPPTLTQNTVSLYITDEGFDAVSACQIAKTGEFIGVLGKAEDARISLLESRVAALESQGTQSGPPGPQGPKGDTGPAGPPGQSIVYHKAVNFDSITAQGNPSTEESCGQGPGFIGGACLNWISAGERTFYSLNVLQAGIVPLSIRASSMDGGARLHFEMNGVNVSGTITVPATGSYQTYTVLTAPQSVTLMSGTSQLVMVAETGGFNVDWFAFQ